MLTFCHSGALGDVLCSLGFVKEYLHQHGQRGRFLLKTGAPNHAANHPLNGVLLNRPFAEQLLPLLRRQPYIAEAGLWEGEQVDLDLDLFRQAPLNLGANYIARYYCHLKLCAPKLWLPWLEADPVDQWSGWVVVNRTARYRGRLNYHFLRAYPKVLFLGLPQEFGAMRAELGPAAIGHTAKDYLEAAGIIKAARVFVGNQSSCYMLAESMKCPRVLELCPTTPNVVPQGDGPAYDCVVQELFEAAVEELTK